MCGLQVDVEDDHVKLIRGDRDDVWSKGYLCPKGTTLGHLHDDPDRIRQPMVRDGDTWREVTWDEAFARCEELIHGVRERHGIDAITAYIGNPIGHNFTLGRYMPLFIGQSGMPLIYSAGTVDQWPKNVSSVLMYGDMWKIPSPDIQRTDYLICMGGNPQASAGRCSRAPTSWASSTPSGRAAARSSSSTPVAPAPPTAPTSGSRSCPAPTPPSCSRCATCCSPKGSSRSATSPTWSKGFDEVRALVRRLPARSGRRRLPRSRRHDPAHRPRVRGRARPARSTAASGCATRSSARSRRGSSTS